MYEKFRRRTKTSLFFDLTSTDALFGIRRIKSDAMRQKNEAIGKIRSNPFETFFDTEGGSR